MKLCPHCHQPMPEIRFGVRLSPLKARIFDLVKRAGDIGIATSDIMNAVYEGPVARELIAMHIHQINDQMASTSWRIRGHRASRYSTYHLVQEKVA